MVAGCSFSAVSRQAPGTSWSEQMAEALGWRLTNMARQGCSNGGVRIMIDEMARQRPDFAVITPTFWDRMEIPTQGAPFDWSQTTTGEDPVLQKHLQQRTGETFPGYDRTLGVKNINYGVSHSTMICETIFSLAENFPHDYRPGPIAKNQVTAIRHYIDCLYDNRWKKQQDEWIIRDGLIMLHLQGIAFLLVPCLLWPWGNGENPNIWRDSFPDIIPDDHILLDQYISPLSVSGRFPFKGQDPGYHMSALGQKEIARNYMTFMLRQGIITDSEYDQAVNRM